MTPHTAPPMQLRVLDDAGCRNIHRAVLDILLKTGIDLQDEDTRRRLMDTGCRERANGFVSFPETVVERALAALPRRVMLYDRGGRPVVDTASPVPRFCPGVNCIDVLDHRTGEIRPCLLEDIARTARVCEGLEHMDMAANLGNPGDLPPEEQALASVRTLVEHSQKPVAFIGHDDAEVRRIWKFLAGEAGGWPALADRPFGLELTGPTSPLTLKGEACRRLRFAAERRLPVVNYPALFPGINGPMTLAGAVAQSSAEMLAGVVVHQTAQPGAPLISGSAVIPLDMRTVTLSYGSPEYLLAGLASADYLCYLGVPAWIGAGCSDAHLLDGQAYSEAAAGIFTTIFSGARLIHNLGFLSSGKTGSLELLVWCNELAGMAKRMARGVDVDAETLAVGVTLAAGESGDFLKHPHTKTHVRQEMWVPTLMQRFSQGTWRDRGATDARERIRGRLAELLKA